MSIKKQLGLIIQIKDLRSVWANEASDFTPWLAENIAMLNARPFVAYGYLKYFLSCGLTSINVTRSEIRPGCL